MSLKPPVLNPILLIFISAFVFRVFEAYAYARPLATNPAEYVAAVSPENSTVVLKSSDGEKFSVELHVALQSEYIKQIIEDGGISGEIVSLPDITGEILSKVIDHCRKHVDSAGAGNSTAADQLKAFDAEFVNVPPNTLLEITRAANNLKINSLWDLASEKVGDLMKGKTPEEIRKMFNINDACVDHEKEEQFVQENAWAFE